MRILKAAYRRCLSAVLWLINAVGLNVVRSADYYSPLPLRAELGRSVDRWYRPSALAGVQFDLDGMRALLIELVNKYPTGLRRLPTYETAKGLGYGPGFTRVDAMLLYCMLRRLTPRRYIEVGSGLSTYFAHLAVSDNAEAGAPCAMTCIDPHARPALVDLADVTIIQRPVQDLPPEFFGELGSGDVLFIDSTHVVKIDGDVPFLYLEVVPRLAPGVVVHSHDIHFPFNVPYPAEEYIFAAKWPVFWTEAMLLQAFLSFNPAFEIVLSAPLLRFHDEEFLATTLPGYRQVESADYSTHFGSLWFRRRP